MSNIDDLNLDSEELQEEIQEERKSFDLLERLTARPKRKPEVVEVYLDDEKGEELGYATDVRNDIGVIVGRERAGLVGDLDRLKSDPESDEKATKALERKIKKLVAEIRQDALVFTLQWIPPVVEKSVEKEAFKAIGVKARPIPDDKIEEFREEYFARLLVATLVKIEDRRDGGVISKLDIATAQRIRGYLPKSQFDRLDTALGKLQYRAAIHNDSVDNPDF